MRFRAPHHIVDRHPKGYRPTRPGVLAIHAQLRKDEIRELRKLLVGRDDEGAEPLRKRLAQLLGFG